MNFIDLSGADMWRNEMRARRAFGGDLYFHRPRPAVMQLWQQLGFIDELGVDHIFPAKRVAIDAILQRLDRSLCAHCAVRVFEECAALPQPVPPFIGSGSAPRPQDQAAAGGERPIQAAQTAETSPAKTT
jgi:SulP family sulfate permease